MNEKLLCDTCNHPHTDHHCEKLKRRLTICDRDFIEIAGCGSHSEKLAIINAVYTKFDHLDKCLSDTEWCESGDGGAIYGIAGEMWRAIKESLREDR